jgi:hypothetical protein
MNNDRELLELAAKAAGISIKFHGGMPWLSSGKRPWDPLTDDGDALRLAVKLKLWTHSGMGNYHDQPDPYAATRLAIVRAAAAIGEAMP